MSGDNARRLYEPVKVLLRNRMQSMGRFHKADDVGNFLSRTSRQACDIFGADSPVNSSATYDATKSKAAPGVVVARSLDTSSISRRAYQAQSFFSFTSRAAGVLKFFAKFEDRSERLWSVLTRSSDRKPVSSITIFSKVSGASATALEAVLRIWAISRI